jgi:hypothetical protein
MSKKKRHGAHRLADLGDVVEQELRYPGWKTSRFR